MDRGRLRATTEDIREPHATGAHVLPACVLELLSQGFVRRQRIARSLRQGGAAVTEVRRLSDCREWVAVSDEPCVERRLDVAAPERDLTDVVDLHLRYDTRVTHGHRRGPCGRAFLYMLFSGRLAGVVIGWRRLVRFGQPQVGTRLRSLVSPSVSIAGFALTIDGRHDIYFHLANVWAPSHRHYRL